MPVFSESAELYDLIYSTFKDYRAETEQIATLLRSTNPAYRTVLDVACGTGEHAYLLATVHGFTVDGLDLDPNLLRVAQVKHPGGRFFEADMSDFRLPNCYDVILCLFSSIGYVKSLDRLEQTLRCFRRHVESTGIVVVEPWFPPDVVRIGPHPERIGEGSGIRVRRAGTTEIEGRISRLLFEYTIEDAGATRRVTEVHELGLFTVDEMLGAFSAAGLAATYDADGPSGRGLYVARVAT